MDPWSETRNVIDACLVTDNIDQLKTLLGNQIKFIPTPYGEVSAKIGAGWSHFNFLTA